jgi:hypothetical protein
MLKKYCLFIGEFAITFLVFKFVYKVCTAQPIKDLQLGIIMVTVLYLAMKEIS